VSGTVVITGSRGYIAGALSRRLANTGCSLRLVSRDLDASETSGCHDTKVERVAADLRDVRAWVTVLRDASAVVHLSSRTDLRAAEADPAADQEINIEPVRALIKASAEIGTAPRVIFASTATIVGAIHENPVDEHAPDNPSSVYDRHKLICEQILRQATGRGHLKACSLRLSNVYGLGSASANSNRGILNIMMQRAVTGEPLTLFGDGSYVRDFIHIEDVVEAFYAALRVEYACDGSHYLICSGQGHTLAEAYGMISDQAHAAIGHRIEVRNVSEPADLHPIERRNFVGNPFLFSSLTGWRPTIELEQGIKRFFCRVTKECHG
jgi:nucleoside-diphosphate-sugar epimerase